MSRPITPPPPVAVAGFGLIAMLGFLSAVTPLSIDMYLPSLPRLADELTTSSSMAQISVSTFFFGLALGQLLYGPLSDRFGRRPALLLGFGLYLAASLACALTRNIEMLIVARAVQGLGAAASPSAGRAIIRDHWSGNAAARAMSFVMMVMSVAPLLAPLLGAQILVWLGWRAIFWVLAGFAVLSLGMVLLGLPETNGPARRGNVRMASVYRIYGHVLVDPRALAWLVCGGLVSASMFAYITSAPFLYIRHFGVDARLFGFYFGFNIVGMVVGNLINGRLVSRFGYRRMMGCGTLVLLLASLVLAVGAAAGVDSLALMVVCLFFAVGVVAMASANAVTGLLDLYPHNAGACSALFGLAQYGLGAVAGFAAGAFYSGTPASMASIMAVCGVVAFAAYLALRRLDGPDAA